MRRVVIIMIIIIIVIFIVIFIMIIMIIVIIAGHGVAEDQEESRSGASGHGDMFPLVTRQH